MSQPELSPDGRWRWDGHQWVPNSAATPPPPPIGAPPYIVVQRTNGLAIASLVLGILWLCWIGSLLALVFGYVALGQIKSQHEAGRGLAIAGIVLGWIGVATFLLTTIWGNGSFTVGP